MKKGGGRGSSFIGSREDLTSYIQNIFIIFIVV